MSKQTAGRARRCRYSVTCHCPFAPTGTPPVAKHLVSRLLSKSLPTTIVVVAEELTNLKMQDHPLTKNGHILYRPKIPTVYLAASMTAIRTDSMIQRG